MNKKLLLGLSLLSGFLAVGLGLSATGCMTGASTGGTASLSSCVQMAQQLQTLTQSDPCAAAQMAIQAIDAGCYSYLSLVPGASGQLPNQADARAQAQQYLASPFCTGV